VRGAEEYELGLRRGAGSKGLVDARKHLLEKRAGVSVLCRVPSVALSDGLEALEPESSQSARSSLKVGGVDEAVQLGKLPDKSRSALKI
jgi:hypothetical protein